MSAPRNRGLLGCGLVAAIALLAAACNSGTSSSGSTSTNQTGGTTVGSTARSPSGSTPGSTPPGTSVAASGLPDPIKAVMSKPRYKDATWSLLATDLQSGESFYPLNPDQMSFTGSTRKL